MGIFCEINLFKPSDGAFRPGQVVTGLMKYAVDEPTEVDKITTSLKGTGCVIITAGHGHRSRRNTYKSNEVYVDIDSVIQDAKREIQVDSYEVKFCFNLPRNLPSSLNTKICSGFYNVKCQIKYYIRIKFERPGIFAFNRHFRKEITVISAGMPRLPREPTTYGETKKLTKLFSSKENIVQIKATILNSVVPYCGKIDVQYEVENNSDIIVKSVETKLTEVYQFRTTGYHEVEIQEDVPDTNSKTTSINNGCTQNKSIAINVPCHIHSLGNAYIVSRNYVVRIIAELPMPHRNAVLNIPVHIGIDAHAVQNRVETTNNPTTAEITNDAATVEATFNDAPPSYWEAMGETRKDDEDGSDDEIDSKRDGK